MAEGSAATSSGWGGDLSLLADADERRAVFAALDSFRQYRKNAHYNITHRRRQNLYALPSTQWQMLAAPPFCLFQNLNAVDDAIDSNAEIAEEILRLGLLAFSLPEAPPKDSPLDWQNTAKPNDIAKAHSTIRQFFRDWSVEGSAERHLITTTILADLRSHLRLPSSSSSSSPPSQASILIPGAGLARLVFDLTLHGYAITGNEISYHQLLASNWILNHTTHACQHTLYPFAQTFTNTRSRTSQLRSVLIPDIHPATVTTIATATTAANGAQPGEMSMHAGDFVTTYSAPAQRSAFHAVVTVFFIDTAPNLIRYIDAVRNCLQDAGIWINIGPLLWHFDDTSVIAQEQGAAQQHRRNKHPQPRPDEDRGVAEPGSFELTDDEVVLLLQRMGFEVLQREMLDAGGPGGGLGYIQDSESMLLNLYRCSHWVVRKKKKKNKEEEEEEEKKKKKAEVAEEEEGRSDVETHSVYM